MELHFKQNTKDPLHNMYIKIHIIMYENLFTILIKELIYFNRDTTKLVFLAVNIQMIINTINSTI